MNWLNTSTVSSLEPMWINFKSGDKGTISCWIFLSNATEFSKVKENRMKEDDPDFNPAVFAVV
jgi:hypothetical protein